MKTPSKLIAAAAIIGFGAAAIAPAAAQDIRQDYGQYVYTEDSPSRFAPSGERPMDHYFNGTRDNARADVFERLDREHNA